MNTPQEEFNPGDENNCQCSIGDGIGIGVKKVPGSTFDTDPDSDPDPDGKLAGWMICSMYIHGKIQACKLLVFPHRGSKLRPELPPPLDGGGPGWGC